MFYMDQEGVFDAPLAKVWKCMDDHSTHGPEVHPGSSNHQFKVVTPTVVETEWDMEFDKNPIHVKIRHDMFPPLGFSSEVLESPLAGSKFVHIYRPMGDRTAVHVFGDFRSPVIHDEKVLAGAVEKFFAWVYAGDMAYIAKLE